MDHAMRRKLNRLRRIDNEVCAELRRVQGHVTAAERVVAASYGDSLRLFSAQEGATCSREAFLLALRALDVCPPRKLFELARRVGGGEAP